MVVLYLHQQVHYVSRHLLYQDVDHPQDLGLGSGQRGGVNVLLRLGVGLRCVVSMNLTNENIHAFVFLLGRDVRLQTEGLQADSQ